MGLGRMRSEATIRPPLTMPRLATCAAGIEAQDRTGAGACGEQRLSR